MKYIKQISTGKIVHRENPHTDKTLDNAVIEHNIDKADLEVVEENWTEDEWNDAMHNQLSYPEKRRREYPDIGDQLDMLWHAMDTGVLPKVDSFYDTIKTTKDKFPKE